MIAYGHVPTGVAAGVDIVISRTTNDEVKAVTCPNLVVAIIDSVGCVDLCGERGCNTR